MQRDGEMLPRFALESNRAFCNNQITSDNQENKTLKTVSFAQASQSVSYTNHRILNISKCLTIGLKFLSIVHSM